MKSHMMSAVLAAFAFCCCLAAPAAPVMRIPKMKKPPVIDGVIGKGEWADASEVTGFQNYHYKDLYPETLNTNWYLGYDDQCLYMAMYRTIPKEIVFKADCKTAEFNDLENMLLFGDHAEIQVTPHSAARALQQGFGFYKLTANVYGIFADTWYYNGMPGFEPLWNSGCQIKSRFEKSEWWMEIAWPLSSMKRADGAGNIGKADGLEMLMQLVVTGNAVDYSFGGWQAKTWLEFDSFYKVILDPEAPSFHFSRIGDIIHGQLSSEFSTSSSGALDVSLSISDADGKEIFRKSQGLESGKPVSFQAKDLPITYIDDGPKRNMLGILIKSGEKTVYNYDAAFAGHTKAFDDSTYGAYLGSRPKGDYKTQFAYYPRIGKARVKVDLDVIGDLPDEVRNAGQFRLRISPRQGGKDIFSSEFPIKDRTANVLVEPGPLEGEFTANIELIGKDKKVVSSKKVDFVRKKHEWEGNSIGKERVVIPPFRPIEYDGRVLRTRCAEIAVGDGGLPDRITVMGTDLIRSPMRIVAKAGGKFETWAAKGPAQIEKGKGRAFPPEYDQYSFMSKDCPRKKLEELPETDGYEAKISAEGAVAGLNIHVQSLVEYDGFYRVAMTVDPMGKKADIENLEIILDLWDKAGDMVIMRNGGDPECKLAAKDGVLWESGSYMARPIGFKGTFIPVIAVGDGFNALQFRAASDQGWLLDDSKSCQIIERRDGKLSLRLLIVNAPASIEKPRTLNFAIMPLPAKPAVPNWRRLVWDYTGGGEANYFHAAYGWRLYGTGGDNWYLPKDEDYKAIGDCLRHPGKYPDRCPAWQGMQENKVAQKGPILMYSSAQAVGAPLPDADSFKGQWYGDSAVDFNTGDGRVGKARNLNGMFLWDKSECFSEATPCSYDDDLVDNYLFFHRKLVELADTNGTMWDNGPISWFTMLDTGAFGYVRDDGHVQPTCNVFTRRNLLKRLYTMGWMVGKPPFYFFKGFHELPFANMGWAIEGQAYIFSEHGTFFDQFTPDLTWFRTIWGCGTLPSRLDSDWARPPVGPMFAEKVYRSLFACALLHDYALRPMDHAFWDETLKKLDAAVGFTDPEKQAEFFPYWNNSEYVKLGEWTTKGSGKVGFNFVQPEGIFVSIYRSQTKPAKAILWFVNATEQDVNIGFWLDSKKLLGKDEIPECANFDDGKKSKHFLPVTLFEPALLVKKELLRQLWAAVNVRAKDYRAVIVE